MWVKENMGRFCPDFAAYVLGRMEFPDRSSFLSLDPTTPIPVLDQEHVQTAKRELQRPDRHPWFVQGLTGKGGLSSDHQNSREITFFKKMDAVIFRTNTVNDHQ